MQAISAAQITVGSPSALALEYVLYVGVSAPGVGDAFGEGLETYESGRRLRLQREWMWWKAWSERGVRAAS